MTGPRIDAASAGVPFDPERLVGVIGAGAMGAGIAQVAARAGHDVLLYDADPDQVLRGLAGVRAELYRRGRKSGLTEDEARALSQRVRAAGTLAELAPARLVIEAIVESLPIKRALFAELETLVAPDAVLATNTSSLSITAIQDGLAHPERVVGMHFFNPAAVLPLVEVVSGDGTDPAAAAAAFDLAAAWGKTPVHAKSTPGFIVNRIARAFYGEGILAYEAGVADPATIDAVLREGGGFRMGPFELTDLIGHDVNAAVSLSVWQQLDEDPRFTPSQTQRALVAAGRLGRKSGAGWYEYGGEAEVPAAATWPTVTLLGSHTVLRHTGGDVELPSGGLLVRTDGRSAAEREHESAMPTVVFDMVGDAATATRVAIALSPATPTAVRDEAIALLQAAGLAVTVLPDHPGLLVARTLAMLVNIASDVVETGIADSTGVDLAMTIGVSYPRGPMEWGDAIGPAHLVRVLDNLALVEPSGRYRVSPWLRNRAERELPLR